MLGWSHAQAPTRQFAPRNRPPVAWFPRVQTWFLVRGRGRYSAAVRAQQNAGIPSRVGRESGYGHPLAPVAVGAAHWAKRSPLPLPIQQHPRAAAEEPRSQICLRRAVEPVQSGSNSKEGSQNHDSITRFGFTHALFNAVFHRAFAGGLGAIFTQCPRQLLGTGCPRYL